MRDEGYMKRRRVASAERGVDAFTADIEESFFHFVPHRKEKRPIVCTEYHPFYIP